MSCRNTAQGKDKESQDFSLQLLVAVFGYYKVVQDVRLDAISYHSR